MTFQLEAYQVFLILATVIGSVVGMVKILGNQINRNIQQNFESTNQKIEEVAKQAAKGQEEIRALERQFLEFKADKDAVKDDGEALNSAMLSMVQSEYFECFIALQQLNENTKPEERLTLLAKVSKGVAEISKASVNQKKWEIEVRDKVEAAAKAVENIVKKGGLSQESAAEIRSQILGIAKK